MTAVLHPPVARYLTELEHALKHQAGVVPEDALSDAREFLESDWQSLRRCDRELAEDAIYDHFVESFGAPADIARAYADEAKPHRSLVGFAPGWRICCTRCGRSAPAARAGVVRIAARSWHKYVLGWCGDCGRLRWLRLIRDLDETTLTQQLQMSTTPQQIRRRQHRPWLILALILLAVMGGPWLVDRIRGSTPPRLAALPPLELPEGWQLLEDRPVSTTERNRIAARLGGDLTSLTNTVVARDGNKLQINRLEFGSEEDARRVVSLLRSGKSNARLAHQRGSIVTEFVARTAAEVRLANAARYELGIQPNRVRYRVKFQAAPLRSGPAMAWNQLANLCMDWDRGNDRQQIESELNKLAPQFSFGEEITLRQFGLGSHEAKWSLDPAASEKTIVEGADSICFELRELPVKAGIPFVTVTGEICCETNGRAPAERTDELRWTAATRWWPAQDVRVQQLVRDIVSNQATPAAKLQALLDWAVPGKHLKFGGSVTGSRYGVPQVLEQGYGHCWDFSDVFVTLCRASGIPARQVLGWLHEDCGHVWAEVLVDDRGWRQVDPTAGMDCGSDYLPLITTVDGDVPLVYVSEMQIDVLQEEDGTAGAGAGDSAAG